MTICLAALCDEGKSCVVAADRMAVFGAGSLLEFKQDDNSNKIFKLFDNSALLHSGSTQDASSIVKSLGRKRPKSIRETMDKVLSELLMQKRSQQVARLVGGDYDFCKLVTLAGSTNGGVFHEIWKQVNKLDLGEMLLIAPENGLYSIHYLRPPEFAVKSDLPYATVGSGGIYGRAALTIQQYSMSSRVSEALFEVYSAKKASEIVYGVGEPTNMAVLTRNRIIDVSQATILSLEKIRLNRSKSLLTEKESESLRRSLGIV